MSDSRHASADHADEPPPPPASSPEPAGPESPVDERGVEQAGERLTTWWTLPNLLCLIRLLGAPCLVLLALFQPNQERVFLAVFLVLAATDWVDGKLAIMLRQRSIHGARLDSAADAALYGALLVGSIWLKATYLWQEAGSWMVAAVGSYVLTSAVGWLKFGRIPSYHTRAAKTSWLLITVAVVSVYLDYSVWPLRLAMLAVTMTNLEATAITLVLRKWQANVSGLWAAWRSVARPGAQGASEPAGEATEDG